MRVAIRGSLESGVGLSRLFFFEKKERARCYNRADECAFWDLEECLWHAVEEICSGAVPQQKYTHSPRLILGGVNHIRRRGEIRMDLVQGLKSLFVALSLSTSLSNSLVARNGLPVLQHYPHRATGLNTPQRLNSRDRACFSHRQVSTMPIVASRKPGHHSVNHKEKGCSDMISFAADLQYRRVSADGPTDSGVPDAGADQVIVQSGK